MRFSVGKKIGGGFAIVVLLLLVVFVFTFSVVNDAIKSNDKFLNVDQPSLFAINQLKDNLSNTHSHMQKWVNDQSAARSDEPFKLEAAQLLDSILLSDVLNLVELSTNWSSKNSGKTELNNIKEDLNVFPHNIGSFDNFYLRSKKDGNLVDKTFILICNLFIQKNMECPSLLPHMGHL